MRKSILVNVFIFDMKLSGYFTCATSPLPTLVEPKSMWCGRPSFSAVKSSANFSVSSLPSQP
jgi:hypothetical protein